MEGDSREDLAEMLMEHSTDGLRDSQHFDGSWIVSERVEASCELEPDSEAVWLAQIPSIIDDMQAARTLLAEASRVSRFVCVCALFSAMIRICCPCTS